MKVMSLMDFPYAMPKNLFDGKLIIIPNDRKPHEIPDYDYESNQIRGIVVVEPPKKEMDEKTNDKNIKENKSEKKNEEVEKNDNNVYENSDIKEENETNGSDKDIDKITNEELKKAVENFGKIYENKVKENNTEEEKKKPTKKKSTKKTKKNSKPLKGKRISQSKRNTLSKKEE